MLIGSKNIFSKASLYPILVPPSLGNPVFRSAEGRTELVPPSDKDEMRLGDPGIGSWGIFPGNCGFPFPAAFWSDGRELGPRGGVPCN